MIKVISIQEAYQKKFARQAKVKGRPPVPALVTVSYLRCISRTLAVHSWTVKAFSACGLMSRMPVAAPIVGDFYLKPPLR